MEYPFFKCPSPNATQKQNVSGALNYNEPESVSATQSDSADLVVRLIKQSLKIQEECMALLNLLVEFVDSKSNPNEEDPNLIPFGKKNRLFT